MNLTRVFNQKSMPSTRISRGGVVCESPVQILHQFSIKDPYFPTDLTISKECAFEFGLKIVDKDEHHKIICHKCDSTDISHDVRACRGREIV